MKKIWNGIKNVFIVILVVLLLFNLYGLFQRQVKGNPLPMIAGVGSGIIASGSMEPTYKWGDLVLIKSEKSYQVGDIVAFLQTGDKRSTTHRIVSVEGEQIVTQGDANNTTDPPITQSQIYGKVIFAIPFIGYIMKGLTSPLGILCIIGIFLVMYYLDTRKR